MTTMSKRPRPFYVADQWPTKAGLAREFVRTILRWLTPDEVAELRLRNATPEYAGSNACATHDFCDANMALDEAYRTTTGRELIDDMQTADGDTAEEQDAAWWDYINGAWDLAKSADFDPDAIR